MKISNKEILLQTALRLFGEQGYDRTPTSQIAKAAAVSEGLIFRHFGSKVGLLEAILEQGLAQIATTMAAYSETHLEPRAAILQHIERALDTIQEQQQFWSLATKIRFQAEVSSIAKEKLKEVNQFIVQQLSENFQRLGVVEPEQEALLLFAIIDGICIHWLQDPLYPLEAMKQLLLQKYSKP